jgi:hypothetical protein
VTRAVAEPLGPPGKVRSMAGLCGSRCVILRETCIGFSERARLISQLELTNSALKADLVIVPTNLLYIIKTIVSTRPLLSDFKLGASVAGRQKGAGPGPGVPRRAGERGAGRAGDAARHEMS